MAYKPGDTYWGSFTTQRFDTGAATDADSLPTASLRHNGTVDGAVTLTVANTGTGTYSVTGTIPVGYAAGDSVQIEVAATVNSVAGAATIDSFVLDSARVGDAYTRLGAPAGASIAEDLAAVKSDTEAILIDTGTDGVVVAAASKTDYALTSDYDAAKTAAQAGAAMNLAPGAINAAAIATGAIDADAIADNAIDASAIATGAITAATFAAGAIDAAALATGAITAAKFAAGAIDAAAIATDALDADALAADFVSAVQAGLSTLTAEQVNAEVVDVLRADLLTEPTASLPPATPTFEQALMLLYTIWRNGCQQDASERRFYNDAGQEIVTQAISDDGTTFTAAKTAAGSGA